MLQITNSPTISAELDRKSDYQTLRDRITDSAERSVHWMCDLAAALREMRDSKVYQEEFNTWEAFCGSLQIPGFNSLSSRRANQLISALERKEKWANSGTIVPILDEVMQLSEGVVREIAKAPEEEQPAIARKLIEGGPSIKKAKELVEAAKEDSVPPLKWLVKEWSRVGEVTRVPKYVNGFAVYNEHFKFIDYYFQTREEAWMAWQNYGVEYLEKVQRRERRLEEEQRDLEAPPIDVEQVIVDPNSCFGCAHHERNESGFDCRARAFTMALGEDYGQDCSHFKAKETILSPVAEFSVKRKAWAQVKAQRPCMQELEALGMLLDALRDDLGSDSPEVAEVAQRRIGEIGAALRVILGVAEKVA